MEQRYEFCIGPDKTLGRRLLFDRYEIVLAGERWVPEHKQWWLDGEVLDKQRYAAIERELAAKLVDDDATLELPGADREAAKGTPTAAFIEHESKLIAEELPWARPYTWDYDHEMDKIAEVRAAYAELTELAAARRTS